MAQGFVAKIGTSSGGFGLGSTNPITVMLVRPSSQKPYFLTEFSVSLDGTLSSTPPFNVELIANDGTTSSLGTPTSSVSYGARQIYGWPAVAAAESSVNVGYSAEPANSTAVQEWFLTPNGGLLHIQNPLGREHQSQISTSTGFGNCYGIRITPSSSGVNVRGFMKWEE